MKPTSLDELRELAAGFVMQTLTDDELASFNAALRDPALAAALEPELAAHRVAVDYLATSQPVAPPAALRDRLVARIASERAAANIPANAPANIPANVPASVPASVPANDPANAVAEAVASTPNPAAITLLRPSRGRGAWWTTGALVTALAASVVFAVRLQQQVSALRNDVAAREAMLSETREQLAVTNETVRTLTEGGNDLVLVRLSPNQPAGPSLQVFWNTKRGSAVMHASGLRPVSSDRTYVLWMIRDGTPVSVALFTPQADGATLVSGIAVPTSTQGVAAFAVTEEPAGGSPQPTMTPFLVGTVGAL